jgi:plastocyanin
MDLKSRAFVACLLTTIAAGCSTGKDLAQSTRTGKIFDVRIGESLSPKEIEVRLGDEVRWVNARNGSVRIVFVDSLQDKLACQKNFKTKTNTANISANDYASLCFMAPGAYTYNARMESPAPGGEVNAAGRVLVE